MFSFQVKCRGRAVIDSEGIMKNYKLVLSLSGTHCSRHYITVLIKVSSEGEMVKFHNFNS